MNQQKRIAKAVLDSEGWTDTLKISVATHIERHSISSYLSSLRALGLIDSRRNASVFEYRARDPFLLAAYIGANQPLASIVHIKGVLADVPRMPTLAEALLA